MCSATGARGDRVAAAGERPGAASRPAGPSGGRAGASRPSTSSGGRWAALAVGLGLAMLAGAASPARGDEAAEIGRAHV